jgi:hypothetical protein
VAESEAGKLFHLSTKEVVVFVGLAILTLMAALDGTSITVALPVRLRTPFPFPSPSFLGYSSALMADILTLENL